MTVPSAVPASSASSIVTEASSYATTVAVTAVGNATETSALGPAVIVSAPLCTTGTPNSNPAPVRLNASGSGKTGCGASPKTSPENHRFVGGMRPSARRVVGSGTTDS